VIHILEKVEREVKVEPPLHAAYFLSGLAITLTVGFGYFGALASISIRILSAIP
jgi:hypothetical protein